MLMQWKIFHDRVARRGGRRAGFVVIVQSQTPDIVGGILGARVAP